MRAFTNIEGKPKTTKLWCAILSITLMFSFFSPAALAFADEVADTTNIVASGNCGLATDGAIDDSVQWTLDSDGNMRIFGNGILKGRDSLDMVNGVKVSGYYTSLPWEGDLYENWTQAKYDDSVNNRAKTLTVEQGVSFPTDCTELFGRFGSLEKIDVRAADTSNVADMSVMLKGIYVTELDLSTWDTSNVTDMSSMIVCPNLVTLDATGWDTSKVTCMEGLFAGESLREVKGINNWDLSSLQQTVTDIYGWNGIFYNCTNLQGVNYQRFETAVRVNAPKNIMYRLYNPNSGEHFYTSSESEKNHLMSLGWKYEGEGWTAPRIAMYGNPVYRLYNPNAGEHHYTTSASEKDNLVNAGWSYEGIGWYSDTAKTVPLYRLYNPNEYANNHHYTKDANERDQLMRLGWKYEGEAWYGV